MTCDGSCECEAEVIQRVIVAPYSHAENILARLNELEQEQGTTAAIHIIHHEVHEETTP